YLRYSNSVQNCKFSCASQTIQLRRTSLRYHSNIRYSSPRQNQLVRSPPSKTLDPLAHHVAWRTFLPLKQSLKRMDQLHHTFSLRIQNDQQALPPSFQPSPF